VPPPWSFNTVADNAWERSLKGLQGVITVVATALILTWWIIVPALLIAFIWWLRRRRAGGTPPTAGAGAQPEPRREDDSPPYSATLRQDEFPSLSSPQLEKEGSADD
jgi:hypothetical protein